jgi:hypothetical protein
MTAQTAQRRFADEGNQQREHVRCALDQRLERWAKWQLSGRPLEGLALPRSSTLARIQSLRLTDGAAGGNCTARARQSTYAKVLREETHREEELTEQAVFEMSKVWEAYPMFIRAEYLWIVPLFDSDRGQYIMRRIIPHAGERAGDHRRRMAVLLGRSLERYNQILAEARPALALLIEQFDKGWIDAATS